MSKRSNTLVEEAINSLRNELILILFELGLTSVNIAQIMKISKQRVGQIISKVNKK